MDSVAVRDGKERLVVTIATGSYLERLLTTLEVQVKGFALCRLSHGYEIALGSADAPLIHFALAGSGVLHIDHGPSIPFTRHDLVVIPSGRTHSIAAPNGAIRKVAGTEDLTMIDDGLVEVSAGEGADVTTACGIIEATYAGGLGLFDALKGPVLHPLGEEKQLLHTVTSMVSELSSPRFGTRAVVEALLKQMLVLLIRRQLKGDGADCAWFFPSGDARLATALEHMLRTPSAPHTLEGLAAVASMSRSGFAHSFTTSFGQPPIAFLRDLRLRHAARLLEVTNLPVAAIAESVGYASRSYFSRAFRELFGANPRNFRASHR